MGQALFIVYACKGQNHICGESEPTSALSFNRPLPFRSWCQLGLSHSTGAFKARNQVVKFTRQVVHQAAALYLGPPEYIGQKKKLRIFEFSMWNLFSIDSTRLKTRKKVVFDSILVKFWNLPWANIFKRTQDSTKKCLSSNCD